MGYNLNEQMVIEGIVTPCGWDERGTVIAVALSARDEEEYLIDAGTGGTDLMEHIHAHVRVRGTLRGRKRKEVFVVSEYEIIS